MTKEEQIDWLCRLRADLNNGVIFTPWKKEFTEVLNGVLEQEPCEDAISRQAVLDIIDSDWKYEGMEQYINNLPSVKPQQKIGHWIYRDGYVPYKWKCGRCFASSRTDFNYCPNCGAKMIEPKESEVQDADSN